MLQVDLFWVYGIGAMFATAAAKQLKLREKRILGNVHFAALMIYISVIFVPEALWLLWSFPHWETMHVWKSLEEIPTAYVTLFIAGDALLAIVGFWVAAKLIISGKEYAAHIQWIAGYFSFFFVLIHGWDGTGWQRFTWDPTVTGAAWEAGKTMLLEFAKSNVALTLYAMAAPTIAPLIVGGYRWLKDGLLLCGFEEAEASKLALRGIAIYLVGVLAALLMAATASALSIYISIPIYFSIVAGILVSVFLGYALAFRRGGLLHRAITKTFSIA